MIRRGIIVFRFLLTHLMRGATSKFSACFRILLHFYSHTSCEVRPTHKKIIPFQMGFLLTHLMRGATRGWKHRQRQQPFLLTHLMRGATLQRSYCFNSKWFLLTHLMRGATVVGENKWETAKISTHTPHARCDVFAEYCIDLIVYFYSHTSCEVRLSLGDYPSERANFYSHTSCEVRQTAPRIYFWF